MKGQLQDSIPIVVIDDDPNILELITELLQPLGAHLISTTDPLQGLSLVAEHQAPIALVDLMMPEMGGLDVLEHLLRNDPAIDVIVMTAHHSSESAVEAIQRGACDYLTKPFESDKLVERVGGLLAERRRRRRVLELDEELRKAYSYQGIVGRSPLMLEVFSRMRRIAPHYRTVLVTGATGTGKELVAQALHRMSPVASGPFIACNCAAIADTLFESELFGYVKGAFTGAAQNKPGLLEAANGGTIFLDEIGELPLGMQAKLLRVLQNQELHRVGSTAPIRVNLRVIAATNRDLRRMVNDSTFREDLFYRLSIIEVTLPTLAQRREDLPLLQRHFLEQFSNQYEKPIRGLTRRAQALLSAHQWPGNVRELENVIGSACMLARSDHIDLEDLPEALLQGPKAASATGNWPMVSLQELERLHVSRALEYCGGNKVRACELLGISRTTLYRILGEGDSASSPPSSIAGKSKPASS